MKRLAGKLHSRRGVSMLMALVYLLVCLTVGSVVLTASTAAAVQSKGRAADRQLDLDVSSAALLLKDALQNSSFTAVVTTVDDGEPSTVYSGSANLLTAAARTVYESGKGTEQELTVTPDSAQMGSVAASLTVASDYTAALRLWPSDSDGYGMVLVFTGSVGTNTTTTTDTTTEPDPEDDSRTIEVTTVTTVTTTTVQWDGGTISKAVSP